LNFLTKDDQVKSHLEDISSCVCELIPHSFLHIDIVCCNRIL